MDAVLQQEEVLSQVFEEVSWEVQSEVSESEVSGSSEESNSEDSGDEVCDGLRRKYRSLS
jgi:hypothetical protein